MSLQRLTGNCENKFHNEVFYVIYGTLKTHASCLKVTFKCAHSALIALSFTKEARDMGTLPLYAHERPSIEIDINFLL